MINKPSFETSDEESIWEKWMACADDGFVGDSGTMLGGFRTWSEIQEQYPDAVWPDVEGAVPIYKGGWTSVGLSWSAHGGFRVYVNSKKRPWWAVGILRGLWYRWVSR